MAVKNKVQLITYPDSLGGSLPELERVLSTYFPDIFEGGIHILPPYPSSGDRGFAPLTYLEIEPSFGSWEDIRRLGEKYDILLDLMVNHISRRSPYFEDFLKKGKKSAYADLFITLDKIWPDGKPAEEDVAKIFLRRRAPYSAFSVGKTGEKILVWTTFGREDPSEQIDLDVNSPVFSDLMKDVLVNFARNNVRIVRLDAVGYVVKKTGTSCFFVEPGIYGFLDWISNLAGSLGIELLPEVHAHHSVQYRLAGHGLWIYDFILPYSVLDMIVRKNSSSFKEYLAIRPPKQFTMLDCHDGVPLKPDLDGLYRAEDARKVVDACLRRGAGLSRILSDEHKDPDGFDVHQILCSYYSVLGGNDDAYLSARAIQFFVPGIPQVYYAGLLAGENDLEAVERTGEGREINRHNYSLEEIDRAVRKDVVGRLLELIRFRNRYPAFDGDFTVPASPDDELRLSWSGDGKTCTLTVNLEAGTSEIEYTGDSGRPVLYRI